MLNSGDFYKFIGKDGETLDEIIKYINGLEQI
jgi:hypothetical protein